MFTTYIGRIYSVPDVIDRLADTLNFGTITYGAGIWLGHRESSAVLEVIADGSEIDRIIGRANQIAADMGEESILALAMETNAALVLANGDRLPVAGSIMETIKT